MKNKVKMISLLALCAVFTLSVLTGCGQKKAVSGEDDRDKLVVMASFYPMYDFVLKIGGDKVAATNMVPSGVEPHDWEPTASDLADLEQADVFVYSGAGMEHWAEDVLDSLENEMLVVTEASQGVPLREGHHHHHEEENEDHEHKEHEKHEHEDHEHEEHGYDPHVWIAPMNAKIQLNNIKDALVQADPDNKDYYESNYEKWSAECDKLDQEYRDALAAVSGRDIVVSHEAFGYLCEAYGLNQLGIQGIEPDAEPNPGRMAEIQEFVKEHGVKTIFTEELVSPKVAQTIANETGAKVEMLSPLEGLSDEQQAAGDDYFSVMRQNLKVLAEALQ